MNLIPDNYPMTLRKACGDEFWYAACIEGFGVISFQSADPIDPDWVLLHEVAMERDIKTKEPSTGGSAMNFDRGLEVRVSSIIWLADAPWGS